jgi:hypothetical protein
VFAQGWMMTASAQGPIGTVLSDGSHRVLGQSSNVHEELGYRASSSPTGYKLMAVQTTRVAPAPSVPPQHATYHRCFSFILKDRQCLLT